VKELTALKDLDRNTKKNLLIFELEKEIYLKIHCLLA
jgi:hypothetical protein